MPRIIDKEAKKARILQAAMQVFAEKGVAKTKMTDIALAAGIGKGTIYEYFRSKEEIFAEAFNAVTQQTLFHLQQVVQEPGDAVNKLHRLLEISLAEFIEQGEHFLEIMMDFWAEGVRNRELELMPNIDLKAIYHQYRTAIMQVLEEGIRQKRFRPMDTQIVASLILAAIDGLLLQWTLDRSLFTFRQAGHVLLDAFLNGILITNERGEET